jgi:hypothetical protein
MAFPTASGTPSYSGTFIPELWSSKLQAKYYDATVLSQITNHDWEGEIKGQGDKVKIRTIPTLTINDHVSGQNLALQRPTSSNIELLIDKGKSWSVILDDIQHVQQDLNAMNIWTADAAEQMKIAVDTDVLGALTPDVAAANKGATAGRLSANINLGVSGAPLALTKVNVIDMIIDMGLVLDEQNVPETGRFIVIPTWMAALLKKSDLKDASLTGDGASVLRNGRLGSIDRFTLYSSNLLPRVTDGSVKAYTAYAGTKDAISFATQLTKVETLRAESTFGDIMRGLNVYGYKVTKPEAIAAGYIYKA